MARVWGTGGEGTVRERENGGGDGSRIAVVDSSGRFIQVLVLCSTFGVEKNNISSTKIHAEMIA